MDKGALTPLAACRIKSFGIGCFRVQNGTLLLYIHHGARWAFAGRDFRLQLPGSETLPFSRIFSVSYATRPRSCRPAHSPGHSSVKAFWGGQRFTLSPSRAAVATSITSSPTPCCSFSSTASHLHSLPRLEVGIAWLRATPKPSRQRREACSTEVSAKFHTRAVLFHFGLLL